MKIFLGLIIFTVFLAGCSIKNLAIDQLAPILSEASPRLQKEKNWHFFKKATPGSLQLAEVFLEARPDNLALQALLTKGFSAYGYIVNDTEYLADKLKDNDSSVAKEQATLNLSKSLSYGMQYLDARGIDYKGLVAAGRKNRAQDYLGENLDGQDVQDLETAFFTGTSWLLLAQLNRDNLQLVSQISNAFELINWVCGQRPDFQEGLCQVMSAVYLLARPQSLGGKPKEAIKILAQSQKDNPYNLLIPLVLIEWYLIPRSDVKEYKKLKAKLATGFEKIRSGYFYPGANAVVGSEMLALFNSMAEQRFRIIVANEEEIF